MELGLTVGDSIDRLTATGGDFAFVELSIGANTAIGAGDEQRLHTALEEIDASLCVHLPFTQVVATPVAEINDAIVAYQRRLLEWAGTIGARKAVLHGTMEDPHDTSQRPLFVEQLERIDAAGSEAGVEVVVENVGHQKLGLPLTVLGDLAREAGTAVCFDVGHAYMEQGNHGVDLFCSRYGDCISHLHVHDARSRDDTHIPIGAGEIDYEIVADELGGFEGTVAIEVFTDDVALLRDTGKRIQQVLESR